MLKFLFKPKFLPKYFIHVIRMVSFIVYRVSIQPSIKVRFLKYYFMPPTSKKLRGHIACQQDIIKKTV